MTVMDKFEYTKKKRRKLRIKQQRTLAQSVLQLRRKSAGKKDYV